MDYVVFDLEWNQSNTGLEEEVERFPFEIIEIGAAKVNTQGHMWGEFSELISPRVYHEMHRITGKLLHLKMSDLRGKSSFPVVAERFEKWCGEKFMFATWGTLDLMELQRNRKYYNMTPLSEGPVQYLDVQKLFAYVFDKEDLRKRRSLEDAVDFLQIEKDIPFHRAYSDAYYTAKVLQVLLKKEPEVVQNVSYDTFYPPKDRKAEVKHQFPTYFKYISRTFPDKKSLLTDREISSSKCYLCHKNLKKKIKWFTQNNRHYYCLAYCEEHGYLKGKIRINKTQEGELYAVKTTKLVSAEMAETIEKRWEKTKEAKKKPGGSRKKTLKSAGSDKKQGND